MYYTKKGGDSRAAALFFILIFSVFVSGCALHPGADMEIPSGVPARVMIHNVPFFAQKEYQCGPAALAMALGWSGLPVTPESLVDEVYTPSKQGSLQLAMIGGARRHGRMTYTLARKDDLLTELEAGNPVIVLLNLGLSWYPVWHYAVAVGYDREHEAVIFHSGRTRSKYYSLSLLDNVWARSGYWGMLVLPPSRLPATVTERAWLNSVIGLERVRQWRSALTAYERATRQWTESSDAWMGVGNCRYQLNMYSEAASAFQRAVELRPDSGIAYNNLAHVLAKLDRREEAIAAAKKAVARGGPHLEIFQKTLSEVQSQQ